MPSLNSEQYIAPEAKKPSTFLSGLKKSSEQVKNLVVKNPITTIAILAAIIAASVFTGGAFLAATGALAVMAKLGFGIALAAVIISAVMASSVENPYVGVSRGVRDEMCDANVSDGQETKAKWTLVCMFSVISAISVAIFPPAGIAILGEAIAAGSAVVTGFIGKLFTSPKNENPSSLAVEVAKDGAINNSYKTALSKLPATSSVSQKPEDKVTVKETAASKAKNTIGNVVVEEATFTSPTL